MIVISRKPSGRALRSQVGSTSTNNYTSRQWGSHWRPMGLHRQHRTFSVGSISASRFIFAFSISIHLPPLIARIASSAVSFLNSTITPSATAPKYQSPSSILSSDARCLTISSTRAAALDTLIRVCDETLPSSLITSPTVIESVSPNRRCYRIAIPTLDGNDTIIRPAQ